MDIRHAVGVKAGIPVEKLAGLPSYKGSPHFTEREQMALEFSERITRDDQEVSEECFSRVRRYFSEPEIVELIRRRDAAVEARARANPRGDALEDRSLEITAGLDISVERRVRQLRRSLGA